MLRSTAPGTTSPTSARAGATLTITGTSLDGTTSVDFTGHSGVTPASASATQVTVVVPGDAATGVVTLNTGFGSVDTESVTILPPAISSISVSSQTPYSVLFVFGAGFADVTEVDIGATQITSGISVDSLTQLEVAIPGGTATGTVQVIAGTGTSNASQILYEHSNGLGQHYYSTNPLSTWTYGDASSAGGVWSGGSFGTTTCSGEDAIQIVTSTKAAVWVYGAGALQGHVSENDVNNTPTCPVASDASWN